MKGCECPDWQGLLGDEHMDPPQGTGLIQLRTLGTERWILQSSRLKKESGIRMDSRFTTHTLGTRRRWKISSKTGGEMISNLAFDIQPNDEENVSRYASSPKIYFLHPCSENYLKMCSIKQGGKYRKKSWDPGNEDPMHDRDEQEVHGE